VETKYTRIEESDRLQILYSLVYILSLRVAQLNAAIVGNLKLSVKRLSRDGTGLRALTPGLGLICGMCLFLVLVLAPSEHIHMEHAQKKLIWFYLKVNLLLENQTQCCNLCLRPYSRYAMSAN